MRLLTIAPATASSYIVPPSPFANTDGRAFGGSVTSFVGGYYVVGVARAGRKAVVSDVER